MSIAAFATALQALKAGTDIASTIIRSDRALAQAEMKLKLAELVGTLAESTLAVTEAQQAQVSMQAEIDRLRQALETKGTVRKRGDAYFMLNERGDPSGDPYCLRCWEVDSRLIHLTRQLPDFVCAECQRRVKRIDWPKQIAEES